MVAFLIFLKHLTKIVLIASLVLGAFFGVVYGVDMVFGSGGLPAAFFLGIAMFVALVMSEGEIRTYKAMKRHKQELKARSYADHVRETQRKGFMKCFMR